MGETSGYASLNAFSWKVPKRFRRDFDPHRLVSDERFSTNNHFLCDLYSKLTGRKTFGSTYHIDEDLLDEILELRGE